MLYYFEKDEPITHCGDCPCVEFLYDESTGDCDCMRCNFDTTPHGDINVSMQRNQYMRPQNCPLATVIDLAAENDRLKERNLYLLANLKLSDTERVEALESENERLKAKLDEIKAECNKAMLVKNPLKHTECLTVIADKLNVILSIIDKDGDAT